MNERSDSSGLPLRAMVMVLLFLGVVFLLVGLQAMGRETTPSDDDVADGHGEHHVDTVADVAEPPAPPGPRCGSTTSPRPQAPPSHGQPAAGGGLECHRDRQPQPRRVTATTVYFSDAPGEQEAADEVGQAARRAGRAAIPELTEQPPGVIVAVTG